MVERFTFNDASIPGLKIITPFYSGDFRGHFIKNFERNVFKENGVLFDISESFETESSRHVLRGLHIQLLNPQIKLVRAISGTIWDVAVDLRKDSPTYGRWHAETLSGENRKSFLIPKGFAHGFFVLSEHAMVSYLCSGEYKKEYDGGVVWNDPELAIAWPIPAGVNPILSIRDQSLPLARNIHIEMEDNI